jgi:hypothetical protein
LSPAQIARCERSLPARSPVQNDEARGRQLRAPSARAECGYERLPERHPIRLCDPPRENSPRNDAHTHPNNDEQPRPCEVRYGGRWKDREGKTHRQPASNLLLRFGQLVAESHPYRLPAAGACHPLDPRYRTPRREIADLTRCPVTAGGWVRAGFSRPGSARRLCRGRVRRDLLSLPAG